VKSETYQTIAGSQVQDFWHRCQCLDHRSTTNHQLLNPHKIKLTCFKNETSQPFKFSGTGKDKVTFWQSLGTFSASNFTSYLRYEDASPLLAFWDTRNKMEDYCLAWINSYYLLVWIVRVMHPNTNKYMHKVRLITHTNVHFKINKTCSLIQATVLIKTTANTNKWFGKKLLRGVANYLQFW